MIKNLIIYRSHVVLILYFDLQSFAKFLAFYQYLLFVDYYHALLILIFDLFRHILQLCLLLIRVKLQTIRETYNKIFLSEIITIFNGRINFFRNIKLNFFY